MVRTYFTRIDLPNDNASKVLLERVLKSLAHQFDNEIVTIDTGVFNAARISKLYGTLACKGDNTPERSHRLAQLLNVPDVVEVVPIEKLQALADELPDETPHPSPSTPPPQRPPPRTDYFSHVNTEALARLAQWVPALFPGAKLYQQGYRVTSKVLNRDLEEDLSILPSGIKDFGLADQGDSREGRRTPIDLVKEWLPTADAVEAAHWLCDQMGIDPVTLGWRQKNDFTRTTQRQTSTQNPTTEHSADAASDSAKVDMAVLKATIESTIEAVKTNVGAVFEDDFLDAAVQMIRQKKSEWMCHRDQIKKANRDVSISALDKDIEQRLRQHQADTDSDIFPYEIQAGAFIVNGKYGPEPLCNFTAKITHQVTHDDGAEATGLFEITVKLSKGRALPSGSVEMARFQSMSWVPELCGNDAIVYAGLGVKDHLRCAIQKYSGNVPRTTVYWHIGWRKIDDEWLYLHNGGALGIDGNRDDITVDVDKGAMQRYIMPDPDETLLDDGFQATLKLLNAASSAIGWQLIGALFRSVLGELYRIDTAVFIVGRTGAGKSELAAIVQAYFGSDFDSRSFPANWEDTPADSEIKSFHAKDAIFSIDDFKPKGGAIEVKKLHSNADRILRGAGNQSGRGRRDGSLKARAARYPRGLILSTGEDIPQGQSLRARMTISNVEYDDIDWSIITTLQEAAREGLLNNFMACFIQWLAGSFATLKDENKIRHFIENTRQELHQTPHKRLADAYANLLAGVEYFLSFAEEKGLITSDDHQKRIEEARTHLTALVAAQADYQRDSDECARFINLVVSGLDSGRWHFADRHSLGQPDNALDWGWRKALTDQGKYEESAVGECIGYIENEVVYLSPEVAFAGAQRLAKEQGIEFEIAPDTLWRRLKDKKMLAFTDAKDRTKTRVMIRGKRGAYIATHTFLYRGISSDKTEPTAPNSPNAYCHNESDWRSQEKNCGNWRSKTEPIPKDEEILSKPVAQSATKTEPIGAVLAQSKNKTAPQKSQERERVKL